MARVPNAIHDETEWNLREMIFGEGITGLSDFTLHDAAIHASSGTRGGHESFWKMDPDTMRKCTEGVGILQWTVLPVTHIPRRHFGTYV